MHPTTTTTFQNSSTTRAAASVAASIDLATMWDFVVQQNSTYPIDVNIYEVIAATSSSLRPNVCCYFYSFFRSRSEFSEPYVYVSIFCFGITYIFFYF